MCYSRNYRVHFTVEELAVIAVALSFCLEHNVMTCSRHRRIIQDFLDITGIL